MGWQCALQFTEQRCSVSIQNKCSVTCLPDQGILCRQGHVVMYRGNNRGRYLAWRTCKGHPSGDESHASNSARGLDLDQGSYMLFQEDKVYPSCFLVLFVWVNLFLFFLFFICRLRIISINLLLTKISCQ